MARIGPKKPLFLQIGDDIKRGGKKWGARQLQNGAEVLIYPGQHDSRVRRDRFQLLDQRANHGGDQSRPHAMAHDVAEKETGACVRKSQDIKKVAAHLAGRTVTMTELKPAFARRDSLGKRWILL